MFERLLARLWLRWNGYCPKCGEYDGYYIHCDCSNERNRLDNLRHEETRVRMKAAVATPRGGE